MVAVILAIAIFGAYANTWHAPFVYDDFSSILDNASIRSLGWNSLAPPPGAGVGGRPVLNLSFAVDYAIGRGATWPFHVTNLLIHFAAALTLFGIVGRTTWRAVPAFAAALLFAVHPLQTEAVTYISQRAESLMGLFYLLTVYGFIRFARDRRQRWGVVSVIACGLGMATKEVMVTAPLMVLWYDRVFVAGTFRAALRSRGRYYGTLAATWAVLLPSLLTLSRRGVGLDQPVGPWAYGLEQITAVTTYLRLLAWPHPLVFDYGRTINASVMATAIAALGLIAAGGLVILAWRRGCHGAAFLGVAGGLLLAPTSTVVPIALQPMAEHRLYLVMAVAAAAVGMALDRWRATVAVACCALAGGAGMVATFARNTAYASEVALWRDTAAKAPGNDRAQTGWGMALCRAGHPAAALPHFVAALQLRPNDAPARLDYGNALLAVGRPVAAERELRLAAAWQPDFPQAHFDLGLALERQFRWEDALAEFTALHRTRPTFAAATVHLARDAYELGMARARAGDQSAAVELLTQAATFDPASPVVQNDLGVTLASAGRFEEAIARFETAVRNAPNFARARENLALARQRLGARTVPGSPRAPDTSAQSRSKPP